MTRVIQGAGAATVPEPPANPAPISMWVLGSTSLLVLLVFINQTGLTVTMPTVSRSLGASATEASWFLLSYMLVMTGLVLATGRLTDLTGRRRLYLGGIVVFLIATVGCAVATSPTFFIVSRVIQGIGAAAIVTNTTAILTDVYAGVKLSVVLGANATVAAVGQTLGPLVGGSITGLAGWRAMFVVETFFGLVALVAAYFCIPHDHRLKGGRERFDFVGAVLSFVAVVGVIIWLNQAPYTGWLQGPTGVLAAVTVVFVAAFFWSQARAASPLLDLTLFKQRAVAIAYSTSFLNSVSNFAVVLLASLYLQNVVGFSAFQAGLVVASASLATMISAMLAGRLTQRFPLRVLTSLGMAGVAVGAGGLALGIDRPGEVTTMVISLFVLGFGVGLFMTPNTTSLMSSVDTRRIGVANAVRTTLQNAGYTVSTTLALTLSTAWMDESGRQAVYDGTLGVGAAASEMADFLLGTRITLVTLVVLALIGLVLCWVKPRAPRKEFR